MFHNGMGLINCTPEFLALLAHPRRVIPSDGIGILPLWLHDLIYTAILYFSNTKDWVKSSKQTTNVCIVYLSVIRKITMGMIYT
jgi:hypothetical protein